jgi:hypothetical protein
MLISEFIKELEELKVELGDVDILSFDSESEDDEAKMTEPIFCIFKDNHTGAAFIVIGDKSWKPGSDQEDDDDE